MSNHPSTLGAGVGFVSPTSGRNAQASAYAGHALVSNSSAHVSHASNVGSHHQNHHRNNDHQNIHNHQHIQRFVAMSPHSNHVSQMSHMSSHAYNNQYNFNPNCSPSSAQYVNYLNQTQQTHRQPSSSHSHNIARQLPMTTSRQDEDQVSMMMQRHCNLVNSNHSSNREPISESIANQLTNWPRRQHMENNCVTPTTIATTTTTTMTTRSTPNNEHREQNNRNTMNYHEPDQNQQQQAPVRQKDSAKVVNFGAARLNLNEANKCNLDDGQDNDEEVGESRKKKYLTAKYGQHQMSLIKKRLRVEMWLYERLQEFTLDNDDSPDDDNNHRDSKNQNKKQSSSADEIDIDLDNLLDMSNDEARRLWLKRKLEPLRSTQTEDTIDSFANEIIEQSKLL